jgi:hypothetical protein
MPAKAGTDRVGELMNGLGPRVGGGPDLDEVRLCGLE